MSFPCRTFLARLATLAAACLALAATGAPSPSPKAGDARALPNRVIVRPASKADANPASPQAGPTRFASEAELSATGPARSALQAKFGIRTLRTFKGLGGMEVLELPAGMPLEKAIAALESSGLYAYAEPDYELSLALTPNDPRYADGTLWGLHNTGQSAGAADADIDAPEAWDIRTDASTVVVGVIDTGIRRTHQDLVGNLWVNPGEIAGNNIDEDANGYIDDVNGINSITNSGNPNDDNGHGSHCAGTIGGFGNNGVGVAGVAWRVKLMGLKFLDADGSGSTSDAIECINYGRLKGAHILSNSWGGGGASTALSDAIAACRAQGIIFVAAAGNETTNTDEVFNSPSGYELDNIVSVAATDRLDALADFSNYGFGSVQIGAPGVSIYSTVHTSDTAYDTYSGTSMATPHVAGALALIKAQFPADTYAQLINRLLRGVDRISSLSGTTLTGGRLNVRNSLTGTLNTPTNDDLASAIVLPATTNVYLRASNQHATPQSGEPLHATLSASRSVWFSWTAPASAPVTISLAGSSFDTLLGIYTGSSVSALTEVAGNDDAGGGLTTSRAVFNATQGTTYRIAVDGKGSATGTIVLRLTTPPVNDAFASASALNGLPGSATGTNTGAGRETGEPTHAGATGGSSVWWNWTAPSSGTVAVSTAGSSFDTLLGVYTGSTVNALTTIASNDNASTSVTSSRLTFSATAGTTYRIAVDGKSAAAGAIALSIATPPANDTFSARIVLPATAGSTTGTNVGAGREAGEPTHGSTTSAASVWWSWTAPSSGAWVVNTIGSGFDTLLGLYTGSSVGSLSTVATDDDGGGNLTSRIAFTAVAGTTYQIAVDGYGGETGSIVLNLSGTVVGPSNDAFASRLALVTNTGGQASALGDSTSATKEVGEPNHAGLAGGKSVWWSWTATADGDAVVDTFGSAFDTLLGIYTGTAVGTLTEVASNDNSTGFQSRVSFPVANGTTYQIAIDGSGGTGGSVVVSLQFTSGNQRPIVTAASLTPSAGAYADAPLSVTGVVVNDAEGDATTLAFQWQSSADGSTWADQSGATAATLAPSPANAGLFWRCRIRASDTGGAGPEFTTGGAGVSTRPIQVARSGSAYSFLPGLPLAYPLAPTYDRTVWINEFSQGPSGTASEWVEFLVLQRSDLRSYQLRDVNSSNAITLSTNALWSDVPAGTLIVLYNGTSKDTALPADDTDLTDRRLIVPANGSWASGTWPGFSNSSPDGIALRDANGTLVDGLSYGGSVVHAPALGSVGSARAAHFTGDTTAGVDSAAQWTSVSSAAANVTPGAGNTTANSAFVQSLRSFAGATAPVYSLQSGALPNGLTLDPATGQLSGTLNVPAGGFFTFTLRRTAWNGVYSEREYQLLVGTAAGVHTVPSGATFTLTGPLSITGALVMGGTLADAGHAVVVLRTYEAFAELNQIVPGDLSDPAGDSDSDTHSNFMEFALGGNAHVSSGPLMQSGLAPNAPGQTVRPTLTFRRQTAPRLLTYTVQWTSNFTTWTPFDLETHLVASPSTPTLDGYEEITVQAPATALGTGVFLRVVVE